MSQSLTIGLVDELMLAFTGRLVDEGHTVNAYMGVLPKEVIQPLVTRPGRGGKFNVIHDPAEFLRMKCDFYVVPPGYYFKFDMFEMQRLPVIGYDEGVWSLEEIRHFGKEQVAKLCDPHHTIRVPPHTSFKNAGKLKEYLLAQTNPVVVKGTYNAALFTSGRTVVGKEPRQLASLLESANDWFDSAGHGGAIVEEYCPGLEVCFGSFFDGEKFSYPIYVCEEHKGAQNSDRGNVMTCEVGTPLLWLQADSLKGTRLQRLFDELTPLFKGRCRGLIDINTIINPQTGEWSFLEFTCRWGRPTLEVMLAMLHPDANFGYALFQYAKGMTGWLQTAFQQRQAVGVTVFPYGYPLIDRGKPRYSTIEYDFPRDPCGQAKTVQFFCDVAANGRMKTTYNLPQFTTVGLGDTTAEARMAAYGALREYSLLYHTWRDDVGIRLPQIYNALIKHNVLSAESFSVRMLEELDQK